MPSMLCKDLCIFCGSVCARLISLLHPAAFSFDPCVWLLVLSALSLCTWPHALCFSFESRCFFSCACCHFCASLLGGSQDTSSHKPGIFEDEHAHPRACIYYSCALEVDPFREISGHTILPSCRPLCYTRPPAVRYLAPRSHHKSQVLSTQNRHKTQRLSTHMTQIRPNYCLSQYSSVARTTDMHPRGSHQHQSSMERATCVGVQLYTVLCARAASPLSLI